MKTRIFMSINLLLVLIHFNLYSQNKNNLLPICKNHLWGIIDTLGNQTLSPQYESINLSEYVNLAFFTQNNRIGLINDKGKSIFPAQYKSLRMLDSVHILAQKDSIISIHHITKGLIQEGKNDNYYTITKNIHAFRKDSVFVIFSLKNAKQIQIPADSINRFEKFEQVQLYYFYARHKMGCFDEDLNIKFTPRYEEIKYETALRKWLVKENGKYGIVSTSGKTLYPPQFDRIEKNFGYINVYKDGKMGVLDTATRIVIPIRYDEIKKDFEYWSLKNDGKVGLLNDKYQEILPVVYDLIERNYGFWIVQKNEKYGVLNAAFKVHIPIEYEYIGLRDNYFYFKKNGNIGIKLKNGTTILNAIYSDATALDNNTFIVEKDGQKALYTEKGLVSKWYSSISQLSNNYFTCLKSTKMGIFNRNGNVIIPCQYENIDICYNKLFRVSENKKEKLVSLKGEDISDWYDAISPITDNFIRVQKNNTYGVIDYDNNLVVATAFREIKYQYASNLFLVSGYTHRTDLHHLDLNRYYLRDTNLLSKYELAHVDTAQLLNPYKKKTAIDSFPKKTFNDYLNLPEVFYYGYVNSKNELLLDTLFRDEQLEFDSDLKQLKAETDTAMIVVSLENDGSLIDKVHFKNWIKVYEQEAPVRTSIKFPRYRWDLKNFSAGNSYRLGLLDSLNNVVIDYKFHSKQEPFMKKTNLAKTAYNSPYNIIKGDPSEKTYNSVGCLTIYGVVDTYLGKEILPLQYADFLSSELSSTGVARIVSVSGQMELINKNFIRQKKSYRFIDEFHKGYARVNVGGKFVCSNAPTYSLEEAGNVPTCLKSKDGVLHCIGGRWGIIDTSENIILPLKYDFLQREFRTYRIAQKAEKWGVLKSNFDTLIPFRYSEIRNFKDEAKINQWADIPYFQTRINRKWGVLSEENQMLIPCKYDIIKYLGNKYGHFFGVANYVNKIANWGLINEKGDTIIPLKYDEISYLDKDTKDFFVCKTRRQAMGYIDTIGDIFCDASFEIASSFSQNRAAVSQNGRTWDFINREKKFISHQNFQQVHNFSEDRAAVGMDAWGFIDTTGQLVVEMKFIQVGNFHQGLAWATINRKPLFFGLWKRPPRSGYINKNGKFIIPAKYEVCSDFENGSAIVQTNKKSQVIDLNGKAIYKAVKKMVPLANPYGWRLAKNENNELELINAKGEELLRGQTFAIEAINPCGVLVKLNTKCGIIDSLGKAIIPIQYDLILPFCEDLARIKKGALWGFINKDSIVIEPMYRACSDFENGIALVKTPKRTFYIYKNGQEVPKDSIAKLQKEKALPTPQTIVKKVLKTLSNKETQVQRYTSNQQTLKLLFDKVYPPSEGLCPFSLTKKFWIYDSKGNLTHKNSFQNINRLYNQSIFQLQSFDQLYYLKTNGTWIEQK